MNLNLSVTYLFLILSLNILTRKYGFEFQVFWLITPTDKNLETFEKWALSGRQSDVFFGDIADDCFRIHLVAGDTFMIPTGKCFYFYEFFLKIIFV